MHLLIIKIRATVRELLNMMGMFSSKSKIFYCVAISTFSRFSRVVNLRNRNTLIAKVEGPHSSNHSEFF